MFRSFCYTVLCGLLLALLNPVSAAQLTNLYSASVPVASQQASERNRGFNEALKAVLVKASGQYQQIMQADMLAAWLPAEPYVQTFSYRDNPAYQNYLRSQRQKPELPLDSVPTSEVAPLPFLLEVSFGPSVIQEKMTTLGLPVWGSSRPTVLLWMVFERKEGRSIIGTSDDQGLVEPLLHIAEQRGIPLFLPVADLQEVSTMNVDELWGLEPTVVAKASLRYGADALAMIRVRQTDANQWTGNWVIELKQQLQRGAFNGTSFQEVSEALITDLAATLSSRYAVLNIPSDNKQTVNIVVKQVNTFDDFIGLQNYLKALPPVSSAVLQWVSQGRAAYQLVLVGSKEKFLEHLELGRRLRPDLTAPETAIANYQGDRQRRAEVIVPSVEPIDARGRMQAPQQDPLATTPLETTPLETTPLETTVVPPTQVAPSVDGMSADDPGQPVSGMTFTPVVDYFIWSTKN